MERFVKEYYNYIVNDLNHDTFMGHEKIHEKKQKIDKLMRLRERGLISSNEAMYAMAQEMTGYGREI